MGGGTLMFDVMIHFFSAPLPLICLLLLIVGLGIVGWVERG